MSWLLAAVFLALLAAAGGVALEAFDVPEYVLPSPATVLAGLSEHRQLLWRHLVPTVLETLYGFALGSCVALGLALAVIRWAGIRRLLFSSAIFVRSVPVVVLAPILTLWLGVGMASKVVIVALLTFFPIFVISVKGLTAADPLLLDLMRVLNASEAQILVKVRIPASVPYVFSGLKVAAPMAVVGALVAEWLRSSRGIGHLMALASFELRTDLLWATIAVAAALGLLAYVTVILLERWLVPWNRSERV